MITEIDAIGSNDLINPDDRRAAFLSRRVQEVRDLFDGTVTGLCLYVEKVESCQE